MENSIQNSIMTVLGGEPLSANDIAEQIDFPRQKIYYHIKKLEKANLIFVAETEIVNGITKKSYLKVEDESDDGGGTDQLDDSAESGIAEGDSEEREPAESVEYEPVSEEPTEESTTRVPREKAQVERHADELKPTPSGESILDKLLTRSSSATVSREEPLYKETAASEELTESIMLGDVVYLIPEADYSLGGIDYIVRSAQRKDGKRITLQEKRSLGDHLEHLRIDMTGESDEPVADFTTEEIHEEKEREEVQKPKGVGWGLYLKRRLSGYINAVTFAEIDGKVKYLRASITQRGFRILDQEIYHLPMKIDGEPIVDLPSLVQYVYRNKIKKKNWQKLYLAYYSNRYSFNMDPLRTPDLKGKELDGFIKTSMCKRFSVEPESAIVNWIEYKSRADDPQRYFIASVGDRSPIEEDYRKLVAAKIQPRFTTSIAKIQFDLYRYNFPEDHGDIILVYIGTHRTSITIINDWEIKDSRRSIVSADDFVDSPVHESGAEGSELSSISGLEVGDARLKGMVSALRSLDVRNDKKARAVFEKLESEIYATIKYFKHEGHYLSKHILVSGIGTNLPNIEEYISEDFEKTVSKLVLPETVQYADDALKIEEEDFSVNIGLLLDPKDRLNLLPDEQRSNSRFIYPLNLGKIAAAILILLGSFVSINSYFEAIRLESELKSHQLELSTLVKQNSLFYDISYKLAVTELIHGTKAYDQYLSKKVFQVLKFLTSALPEAVLFDRLVFSKGEDGKTPVLTLTGRISSSGAESNIVLNKMMFNLRDYEMLKQVTLRDRNQNTDGSGESGTVNFTVDLNL